MKLKTHLARESEIVLKALQVAAHEAFAREVLETQMYDLTIGSQGEYNTVEEWLEERINQWLTEARKRGT